MIIYMLVFLAVSIGVFYSVRLVQKMGLEQAELAKAKNDEHVFSNPLNRYISDQSLIQIRLLFAMVAFGGIAGILIFCNITILAWLPISIFISSIGYMLPYWHFQIKLSKRKLAFETHILDLTMGLTNGLRAGQALPQSLEAITHRLDGPIHEELAVVIREYRLGLELSEALERLYQRMPCEDLRLLITSIRLTSQSGGSLVDVLGRMTEMIRSRTEFQEKLRTMTAQGRFEAIAIAAAPLAAFVILYFIDTELMAPMLQTAIGWAAIGVVILLEAIGFIVINKIVTIEV